MNNTETLNQTEALNERLATLRDEYTYRVNMLLEEDRTDLASRLADEYLDVVTKLVGSSAAAN